MVDFNKLLANRRGENTLNAVPSQSAHALLSASSSHKWLHCTPSARLEETLPESESNYANEGRLAHEIGELKLKKHFFPMKPSEFKTALKKLQEIPLYQEEMLKHTDTYLDYVSKVVHSFPTPPYIAIEKRINYSSYAPEGFGTGDCIVIGGNTLHVVDLKYGKGVPVSAENNPQMMLYALGAYMEYSFLYPLERVKVAIIQPRLDSISEWEIALVDLLAWGESILPIADKAFAGEGEFMPGEWCRFCRAKATCRARCNGHTALEDFGKKLPPLISNEEIGAILVRAQGLAEWAKALEEYALSECLRGNEIPGWKAVEGRGRRAYINVDEAFKALTGAGYDEAILYVKEPLSPAKVEELIGKKDYKALLTPHVNTPPGKPTLAPISDKREAISNRTNLLETFNQEIAKIEG
jgi:hypothetical protein